MLKRRWTDLVEESFVKAVVVTEECITYVANIYKYLNHPQFLFWSWLTASGACVAFKYRMRVKASYNCRSRRIRSCGGRLPSNADQICEQIPVHQMDTICEEHC